MKKQEIDHILTRMLDSHKNVSDLNLTVGKPLQVESDGELISVEMRPPFKELTPFQTEIFALNLMSQDRRLTRTFSQFGLLRSFLLAARKGTLPRECFFPERVLLDRSAQTGIQNSDDRGTPAARGHV
jgi:Tfp pilus assembly ATPase PilU